MPKVKAVVVFLLILLKIIDMITEQEEINGVVIIYDAYVKREMDAYRAWMPFTFGLTLEIINFTHDYFYMDRDKPVISVYIGYERDRYRTIELSVKMREAGYGEAELFTMDAFIGGPRDGFKIFLSNFMERFRKNIVRSAVMEKIELYRNPPKPIIDWKITKMAGLALANTAIKLAVAFILVFSFIIYICLNR